MQFHGAVHLRMRREDLLQQGGPRPRQADDEDRIRRRQPRRGSGAKQFRRTHLDLAVHPNLQVAGAVMHAGLLQGIAPGVAGKGALMFAAVFVGLAERKAQLNPVHRAGAGIPLDGSHPGQLVIGKPIGFGIRQAPPGIAVIRLDPVGLPVQRHRPVELAVGLVHMAQQDRMKRIAGLLPHHDSVALHGGFVPARPGTGRGVQGPDQVCILRKAVEQLFRGHQRLAELLYLQQQIDILRPGSAVPGFEFDAALQQKLGVLIDLVARGNLGQQPHAFDMGPVGAQELLA